LGKKNNKGNKTLLAVETEGCKHIDDEWLKRGIIVKRASSMAEAIEFLLHQDDEYLFIAINEDRIPNFMEHLPIMRDITSTPIFCITSTYTLEKEIEARKLGADEYAPFAANLEQNMHHAFELLKGIKRLTEERHDIIAAKQYINKNWIEHFDLDEIAKNIGQNKFRLSKEFKTHTGKTLYKYYKSVKISKLKEKLNNSDISVTNAFTECGLDYNGRFKQFFKEEVGMTPRAYQKKVTLLSKFD